MLFRVRCTRRHDILLDEIYNLLTHFEEVLAQATFKRLQLSWNALRIKDVSQEHSVTKSSFELALVLVLRGRWVVIYSASEWQLHAVKFFAMFQAVR